MKYLATVYFPNARRKSRTFRTWQQADLWVDLLVASFPEIVASRIVRVRT